MREIAVLANMGKSSLYDFFKTKDEIVVYAVEKEIEKLSNKFIGLLMVNLRHNSALEKSCLIILDFQSSIELY